MFYEVVPEGKVEGLTYDFDGSLLPGQIVMVPVGRRVVPGVVIKKVAQPNFKTKSIFKILYSKPLPEHLLKVLGFLHDYYLASSGQAVSLILPRGVQKKRRKTEQMFGNTLGRGLSESVFSDVGLDFSKMSYAGRPEEPPASQANLSASSGIYISAKSNHGIHPKKQIQTPAQSDIPLNPHQKRALKGLQEPLEGTKLLRGITGSGKTNIYLKMALNAFKRQKSSIILVPEIALTGQLVRVFQEVFGENIVLIHSRQTEAERHLIFN